MAVGFLFYINPHQNSSTLLPLPPRLSAVRLRIKIEKLTKLACVSFFVLRRLVWKNSALHLQDRSQEHNRRLISATPQNYPVTHLQTIIYVFFWFLELLQRLLGKYKKITEKRLYYIFETLITLWLKWTMKQRIKHCAICKIDFILERVFLLFNFNFFNPYITPWLYKSNFLSLLSSETPNVDIGPHCSDPYDCDFKKLAFYNSLYWTNSIV